MCHPEPAKAKGPPLTGHTSRALRGDSLGIMYPQNDNDFFLLFYNLPHQPQHFARFGVTVGLEFGIDQPVVHTDLELASIRRYQGQALEVVLKFFEQFICQAHGPVGVVSYSAVDDFDVYHWVMLSKKNPLVE